MIFENSLPKANFGQNIRDSPNESLTADSRSLQTATLKLHPEKKCQTKFFKLRLIKLKRFQMVQRSLEN